MLQQIRSSNRLPGHIDMLAMVTSITAHVLEAAAVARWIAYPLLDSGLDLLRHCGDVRLRKLLYRTGEWMVATSSFDGLRDPDRVVGISLA